MTLTEGDINATPAVSRKLTVTTYIGSVVNVGAGGVCLTVGPRQSHITICHSIRLAVSIDALRVVMSVKQLNLIAKLNKLHGYFIIVLS